MSGVAQTMGTQTAGASGSDAEGSVLKHRVALYRGLAGLTTLVFILIVLGSTVRNMGAGLSCPDWPMCNGQLIPPMDAQVFSEWFHRLVASFVSFGLLGVSFVIYRNRQFRAVLGSLNIAAVILLLGQVVLGGLTVLGLLKSEIVTAHLAVGFMFFGTLLLMALRARDMAGKEPPVLQNSSPSDIKKIQKFSRFSKSSYIVVYFQVLLGGMVSSHYAGLACPDFPTCNGQWFPALQGSVGFQILHRVGALLVFLKVCALILKSIKTPLSSGLRQMMWLVGGLLALQVTLGISSVLLGLPLALSIAHTGVAAALFATLLVVTYDSARLRLY